MTYYSCVCLRVCVPLCPGLIVLTVGNMWRPSNFESGHLIEIKSRDYITCVMCIDLLLGYTHLSDEWNFVSHIVLLFGRGFLWLCLGDIVLIICHLCMFVRCTCVVQMYMFCMCTRQTYTWCTWDIHVLYRCTCVVWEKYMCCTDVHVLYVYTTDVHVLYERCICVVWIFPRKNARSKKSSHKTSDAEQTRARLLYLTQTGGHQVFSTRKGTPAPRFLTNRGQETHLLRPLASPPGHHLGLRRDRKIHTTGPSKPLGYYHSKCTRCN